MITGIGIVGQALARTAAREGSRPFFVTSWKHWQVTFGKGIRPGLERFFNSS